jgi:GNAT superfamily N-acetyltransferase
MLMLESDIDLKETMQGLFFREYASNDLHRCAQLAAEAWPVKDHISGGPGRWRVMVPYIDIASSWSNWTSVACLDSGELVGLMFGEVRGRNAEVFPTRIVSSELRACAKFVLGKYGSIERLPAVLWNFLMTEMKLLVNRPEADAEIMLFLVDSKHRGKGIGSVLMDKFVGVARQMGSTRISVYADDQASNWRFYENYGFERAGVFYDNWSSYFNMNRSMGIRLVLNLERPPKRTDKTVV